MSQKTYVRWPQNTSSGSLPLSRAFVVNASPLILLARIQHLHLLSALADPVVVPEAVIGEVEAGTGRDDAAARVAEEPSIETVADLDPPESILRWDLGAGESQVLAFARAHPGYEAVLDDQAARHCARDLTIPYTGTLGVILTCRHRGHIPRARPVVEALIEAGIRLTPTLVEAALAEVGE